MKRYFAFSALIVVLALSAAWLFLRQSTPPAPVGAASVAEADARPLAPAPLQNDTRLDSAPPVASADPRPARTPAEVRAQVESATRGVRAGVPGGDEPHEEVRAGVQVGNRRIKLEPIHAGTFETVFLEERDTAKVAVTYPQGQAGDAVHVEILDGGSFADAKGSGQLKRLDGNGSLSFAYVPTGERGMARVSLRKGAQINIVDFWVGEPPEMRGTPLVQD